MKRIISLALCFMLAFILCPSVFAAGDTCEIDGTGYATLDAALAAVGSGETKTIKLLEDIDYEGGIVIRDKRITFDLNGFTLNVVNSAEAGTAEEMSGLFVIGDAAVDLSGAGELNVTGSWYGVYAASIDDETDSVTNKNTSVTVNNALGHKYAGAMAFNAKVTVKGNVASDAGGYGVGANFQHADVFVEGNVTAGGDGCIGILPNSSAKITVKGSVTVNGYNSRGVEAYDYGEAIVENDITASGTGSIGINSRRSNVTAGGNVTGDYGGINTSRSEVDITGDVRSLGVEVNSYGVCATSFSHISVEGDVRSNEEGAVIWAEDNETPSTIVIGGVIEAPKYVQIGSKTLDFTDGQHTTTIAGCYIIYEDPDNIYVGAVGVAEYAGGSGSVEDPYLVVHADQLYNVRNHLDKHFKLIENIDMSGYSTDKGWEPIGGEYTPFTGSFDGNGHTIGNLFIKRPITPFIGLFANIGLDAEIRNVSLIDVNVTGYNHVGGLAGRNRGQVTNSYAIGNLTGDTKTGGLVGENSGSIADSYAQGTVTDKYGGKIGGLVGENTASGTIISCYAEVEVTITSGNTSYGSAGGLVGYNFGGITESYAVGAVVGRYRVGGLAGTSTGTIDKSYATGTVTGTINYDTKVGGLVGHNDGSISNSFARGDVSGNDKVGGLVGYNMSSYTSSNEKSSITASYATGKVNVGSSNIGGLAGYNYDKGDFAGIITDSYWDKETSGQSISAGGTGKTTAEMKQQATYVGWNFATIWGINDSDNDGYPFLRWQGNEAEPTVPTVPQNFTATPGDGQVALSWSASASDGGAVISHYEVSSDNGGTWVTAATNTSHTFTGLTNGSAYTFKVRAVNSVGNGAEASVSATPTAAPATAYTVTVNGSYAGTSGAGQYAPGAQVSIHAGSRSNYSFTGWTSPDGVPFANVNNATTTFIMPAKNVTVTANWSYNGGGGSGGGGSSTPTTPASPSYKADVKAGSCAEMTLSVTVDKDAGTASVDAGSQGLDQGGTIITIPPVPDVDTYSVGIPVPDLSTSDVQGTLTVNTDAGSVTVPSNMLTGVSGISGSKAEIAIGQGDKDNLPDAVKAAIGDRPLVQLTLSIDGKRTDWSNPDVPVTVSIPYTPTAAELANPESIVVWYIDGSGNAVSVPNGHYDPTTGVVTFDTTHFSDYAVAYNKVSFNDVTAGAWYAKAVSFIAAREITAGTGGGNFSPEARLTRGQFIVMLMKAYDIAPDANPRDNFSDAGSTYYTGYLAAAKRLGISAGIGNNMFAPEKEITRQEMFTLLYNALKVIGQLPQGDSDKTLDHFSDAGQIDLWAKEAMTLLVKTGTIGGNAGKLNPTSTTTRAEMAQVLYNLLSK